MPRVVIVGGGFGGLYAARALRRAPVEVTVVDRRNHHVFQPLLYQVAMAGLSPGDIASPIRWILRRQKNVEVILAEASGFDLAANRLILTDDVLEYDYLIVATTVAAAIAAPRIGMDRETRRDNRAAPQRATWSVIAMT